MKYKTIIIKDFGSCLFKSLRYKKRKINKMRDLKALETPRLPMDITIQLWQAKVKCFMSKHPKKEIYKPEEDGYNKTTIPC